MVELNLVRARVRVRVRVKARVRVRVRDDGPFQPRVAPHLPPEGELVAAAELVALGRRRALRRLCLLGLFLLRYLARVKIKGLG